MITWVPKQDKQSPLCEDPSKTSQTVQVEVDAFHPSQKTTQPGQHFQYHQILSCLCEDHEYVKSHVGSVTASMSSRSWTPLFQLPCDTNYNPSVPTFKAVTESQIRSKHVLKNNIWWRLNQVKTISQHNTTQHPYNKECSPDEIVGKFNKNQHYVHPMQVPSLHFLNINFLWMKLEE